jgi:hypothetical protein
MNLSHAVSVVLSQVYERRLSVLELRGLGLGTPGRCWLLLVMISLALCFAGDDDDDQLAAGKACMFVASRQHVGCSGII